MKEIRFLLAVFGAIFLLGAVVTLEEDLRLPPVASIVVIVILLGTVVHRISRDFRRLEREDNAPARPLAKGVTRAVRSDETEIVVLYDGVATERVSWDDLLTVGITLEEQGFLVVPWWRLFGRTATASYASDALGAEQMLRELQGRLPGFDNEGVVRAMGMMEGGVVVWEREVPHPAPPEQGPE